MLSDLRAGARAPWEGESVVNSAELEFQCQKGRGACFPGGPQLCSLVAVVRDPLGSKEGGSCSVDAAASTQDLLSDE